jgi:hypothetical protein
MPEHQRGHLFLATIIAPITGLLAITVALVLYAWILQPVEDLFSAKQEALFYLLLIGAGGSYVLEFIGLWAVRSRRKGRALPLVPLLLLSTSLGGLLTPVVVDLFIPLELVRHWLGVGGLGALGGLVAGSTFWAIAPEGT